MVSEESLKLANELENEGWEQFKKKFVATVPSFYPITNQAGGMYNDAQMRHVRPEHDFRNESDKGPICNLCAKWVTSKGDGHEHNCQKFGESVWGDYGRDCGLGVVRQGEGPRSSVVPWISPA